MNLADAPSQFEEARVLAVLHLFPSGDRMVVELGFQTGRDRCTTAGCPAAEPAGFDHFPVNFGPQFAYITLEA